MRSPTSFKPLLTYDIQVSIHLLLTCCWPSRFNNFSKKKTKTMFNKVYQTIIKTTPSLCPCRSPSHQQWRWPVPRVWSVNPRPRPQSFPSLPRSRVDLPSALNWLSFRIPPIPLVNGLRQSTSSSWRAVMTRHIIEFCVRKLGSDHERDLSDALTILCISIEHPHSILDLTFLVGIFVSLASSIQITMTIRKLQWRSEIVIHRLHSIIHAGRV